MDKILNLNLLPLYITPVITVSTSFGSFPINLLCKLIDWSLCDLDTLIEVYGSYLICSIYFIYLFICFMLYLFCLLILLILLFVVVVVAYSFLIHSIVVVLGFLCILLLCLLLVHCCLWCHCVLESCCPFAIVALYLLLFLFSLLTQCVSYSSYCHCYLYNLALVLLVWLLALVVYNFPYGDFIVN